MINAWVEEKTQGKIRALLQQDDLDRLVRLVLTNAIYFKGTWTTAFDKRQTVDEPFVTVDGTTKRVPMMQSKADFPYAETKLAQIIAFPYGAGRLRMVVALPQPNTPLSTLVKSLTPAIWSQWTGGMHTEKVTLFLPRFKAEYATELNQPLHELGMARAFDGRADFSGMNGKRDLYISLVRHKALLEVNEEGTTAAASTAVVMKTWGGKDQPVMMVNHPFLCAIEDSQTGAILFLAAIRDPR